MAYNSTKAGLPLPTTLSKLLGSRSSTLEALTLAINAESTNENENNMMERKERM